VQQIRESGHVTERGVPRRHPGRTHLEHLAKVLQLGEGHLLRAHPRLEDVPEVFPAGKGHRALTTLLALEQSASGELRERLPDHGARHVEARGELAGRRDRVTFGQPVVQEHLLQLSGDDVGQRYPRLVASSLGVHHGGNCTTRSSRAIAGSGGEYPQLM
jgi:hypothetical protein